MALNRLSKEPSSYLQQHSANPVDWFPWSEEALAKAKLENKPILLSIGYSACHWCHVMAHESFEDEETAKIMNTLFINIKVDKEERPDLDKIYQLSHQLLTGRAGGWPLTVFLHPQDQLPFFSGTYFPNEPRHQLPAFKDLLQNIAFYYEHQIQDVETFTQRVRNALYEANTTSGNQSVVLDKTIIDMGMQELTRLYDHSHGGFGGAPKFPHQSYLETLLYFSAQISAQKRDEYLPFKMIKHTLTKMAQGGIYDQIAGGFYRYSVDEKWEIPHFEKMLYDNGQLLELYAKAYALQPNPLFHKITLQTANWVIQNMQSAEGGYYASLDADSDGKEGIFYIWSQEELKSLLTPREYEVVTIYFNLHQASNFEGAWHLHVTHSELEAASELKLSHETVEQLLDNAKAKLLEARKQKVSPHCDHKILTSWNALMIKGMLIAGLTLEQNDFINSAMRALDFIHKNLWFQDRLYASYQAGKPYLTAYLDDYAFLLDAVLTALQYQFTSDLFNFAQQLATLLVSLFYDKEQSGFLFVAEDHEPLILRPKVMGDEAIPAGNSIACFALQRLGYLLGDSSYLQRVLQTLKYAEPQLRHYPAAYSSLLTVLEEHLNPPQMIIIRGDEESLKTWQTSLHKHFSPNRMIFAINNNEVNLPEALQEKAPQQNPVAYVCQGLQCLPAIHSLDELKLLLK